jgi:hypothetical protein
MDVDVYVCIYIHRYIERYRNFCEMEE